MKRRDIPHKVNVKNFRGRVARLLEVLARQARLPLEKFPVVAKEYGNLGPSTCGVALAKALTEHGHKRADQRGPIFVAAVGPGMLWGCGVLY